MFWVFNIVEYLRRTTLSAINHGKKVVTLKIRLDLRFLERKVGICQLDSEEMRG